jgi:phosphate starvation-inducible PhoH-like protein
LNTPADPVPAVAAQVVVLDPADNARLANLCGQFNEHLRQLERRTGVEIHHRGHTFRLFGDEGAVAALERILKSLYRTTTHTTLSPHDIHLSLQGSGLADPTATAEEEDEVVLRFRHCVVKGRGPNQRAYLRAILRHDICFGVGPAGTGKTYLAVAAAAAALEREEVRRICLVRPAVEAGEHLGFLPGDLVQKVDPYLRPLYDALFELVGFDRVQKMLDRGIIEVAPLAFMRGRTLNDSFILLDEAQNTTIEQMKMFLTRIGFGSTAVITGDVTQTDLPKHCQSGLRHVIDVLGNTRGLSFNFFTPKDVVRHPLVARILEAYDAFEAASQVLLPAPTDAAALDWAKAPGAARHPAAPDPGAD